jgi:acetyl-CoA acyltransferase 2
MSKMSKATQVFVVAAKRTPFGTFGGKLKHLSATDLAVLSSKAAIASAKVSAAEFWFEPTDQC